MLPRKYRLPSHKIPEVLKNGRWHRGKLFDLIVLPNSEFAIQHSEFCIIVRQKLSKKSTRRQRSKRLLVEAVHKLLPSIKPGFQVILMAKRILEKEKLQEILPEVKKTLFKAKLLANNLP